jgi:hypothetical protein
MEITKGCATAITQIPQYATVQLNYLTAETMIVMAKSMKASLPVDSLRFAMGVMMTVMARLMKGLTKIVTA